jgi:hypothetical protein
VGGGVEGGDVLVRSDVSQQVRTVP